MIALPMSFCAHLFLCRVISFQCHSGDLGAKTLVALEKCQLLSLAVLMGMNQIGLSLRSSPTALMVRSRSEGGGSRASQGFRAEDEGGADPLLIDVHLHEVGLWPSEIAQDHRPTACRHVCTPFKGSDAPFDWGQESAGASLMNLRCSTGPH